MDELEIRPEEAGIERSPLKVVTGGEPEENARRLKALLAGHGSQAEKDIVVLNSAALLATAGIAPSLLDAAGLAREALMSGKAGAVLDAFVQASND
jgi:anthranilate phosphoribosyltransferase